MKKLFTILLLIIGVNATEDNTLNMSIEEYDKLMLHKAEIALNDFLDTMVNGSGHRYRPAILQLKFDRACNAWDLLTKESKKSLLDKYKHKQVEKVYDFPNYCHVKRYMGKDDDSWYRGHFFNSQ